MTRNVDRLYALAAERGLSMTKLCKEASTSHGSISTIRSTPERDIGLDACRKLAPVLGVSLAELLGEDPPAEAPAVAADPAGLRRIGLLQISRSSLNPRKHFDEDAIRELAESIAAQGLLQNLVVRHDPAYAAAVERYVVVAGERRFRALELLANENRTPAEIREHGIPCRVIEGDDADHVALAILENLQRQDVNPMEEAEAFAQLQEIDPVRYSTKALAEAVGVTQRYVQKRLKLVRDLTPEAREALATGSISVEQANVLASTAAPAEQKEVLRSTYDRTLKTDELRRRLLIGKPKVSAAAFDLATYFGGLIEDEDGNRFADADTAFALQRQAAADRAAALRTEGRAWVAVVEDSYWSGRHYDTIPDHPMAGAVVYIDKTTMQLTVHDHLVVRPEYATSRDVPEEARALLRQARGEAAAGEAFTKVHLQRARRRKTAALQNAIAAGPMRLAVELCCLGLLTSTQREAAVRIDARQPEPDDRECFGTKAAAVIDGFATRSPTAFQRDSWSGAVRVVPGKEPAALAALQGMETETLFYLFRALVALQTGTWNGYETGYGDSETALMIAEAAGVAGREQHHGLMTKDEDTAGIRKDVLVGLVNSAGGHANIGLKVADLRTDAATLVQVLPTFRFGSAKAVKAWVTEALRPAQTDIEDAVKAKAKANAVRPGATVEPGPGLPAGVFVV